MMAKKPRNLEPPQSMRGTKKPSLEEEFGKPSSEAFFKRYPQFEFSPGGLPPREEGPALAAPLDPQQRALWLLRRISRLGTDVMRSSVATYLETLRIIAEAPGALAQTTATLTLDTVENVLDRLEGVAPAAEETKESPAAKAISKEATPEIAEGSTIPGTVDRALTAGPALEGDLGKALALIEKALGKSVEGLGPDEGFGASEYKGPAQTERGLAEERARPAYEAATGREETLRRKFLGARGRSEFEGQKEQEAQDELAFKDRILEKYGWTAAGLESRESAIAASPTTALQRGSANPLWYLIPDPELRDIERTRYETSLRPTEDRVQTQMEKYAGMSTPRLPPSREGLGVRLDPGILYRGVELPDQPTMEGKLPRWATAGAPIKQEAGEFEVRHVSGYPDPEATAKRLNTMKQAFLRGGTRATEKVKAALATNPNLSDEKAMQYIEEAQAENIAFRKNRRATALARTLRRA